MNPEYTEPLDTCPLCGTDDVLYPSITKQYKDEIELLNKADKLQDENKQLRVLLDRWYEWVVYRRVDDVRIESENDRQAQTISLYKDTLEALKGR